MVNQRQYWVGQHKFDDGKTPKGNAGRGREEVVMVNQRQYWVGLHKFDDGKTPKGNAGCKVKYTSSNGIVLYFVALVSSDGFLDAYAKANNLWPRANIEFIARQGVKHPSAEDVARHFAPDDPCPPEACLP